PKPLQQPLEPLREDEDRSTISAIQPMPEARPFTFPVLPAGEKPEDYARSFLQQFGGDLGRTVLWRDKAGHALPISESLFRTHGGQWKIAKRGRETQVLRLAEALIDPDEIWAQWARGHTGKPVLMRSYLRRSPEG